MFGNPTSNIDQYIAGGSATSGFPGLVFATAAAERMRIDRSGNVGIGSTTPWRTLSVVGTVALNGLTSSATGNALCITTTKDITDAGGASCTPSSIRFKENVETLGAGFALDELNKLRVVSFDYKPGFYSPEDAKGSYGLIAEEVADIDSKLVDYGYDGQPLTLKFEKLTGLAIQAIQELSNTIKGFAESFTTAVLNATTGNFTDINGKKLCLDEVCITKTQLQSLLSAQGSTSGGGGEEGGDMIITDVPPPPVEDVSAPTSEVGAPTESVGDEEAVIEETPPAEETPLEQAGTPEEVAP